MRRMKGDPFFKTTTDKQVVCVSNIIVRFLNTDRSSISSEFYSIYYIVCDYIAKYVLKK